MEHCFNIGWTFKYLMEYNQYHEQIIKMIDKKGIIQQFIKLMESDSHVFMVLMLFYLYRGKMKQSVYI